jgi:hypothetical protein
MSSLTSLTRTIHAVVFEEKKPSKDVIVDLGFDIEILENIVTQLKPAMDYMRGYRSLQDLFDDEFLRKAGRLVPYKMWLEEFGEVEKHTQCVELFGARMWGNGNNEWFPLIPSEQGKYEREHQPYYSTNAQRWAGQKVFLTRKGKWIIWASYPASVFRVVDTPRAALDMLQGLTPTGVVMHSRSVWPSFGAVTSPALQMAGVLTNFFRESIAEKEKNVEAEKDLLKETTAPFDTFS